MEIKHEKSAEGGKFYLEENGERIGELHYTKPFPDRMAITHTEVNRDRQGKGLGVQLVDAAAGFARKNNLKVIPNCSFARKVMKGSDKYRDLL